jgi:hypothetical protein
MTIFPYIDFTASNDSAVMPGHKHFFGKFLVRLFSRQNFPGLMPHGYER